MNAPHVIRLRGPWQRRIIGNSGVAIPSRDLVSQDQTVTVPTNSSHALDQKFRGAVEYIRYFHRPTGIESTTPLVVVVEKAVGTVHAMLNGRSLGHATWPTFPFRLNVTGQLVARNELLLRVERSQSEGDMCSSTQEVLPEDAFTVGEVWLEIG